MTMATNNVVVKCIPNLETGYVDLIIEITNAPGIRKAYESAENGIKHMIEKEFKDGMMDWAESMLAEKRNRR
jgi:hypothetical protein